MARGKCRSLTTSSKNDGKRIGLLNTRGSGNQRADGGSSVCDGYGAGSVVQLHGGVDSEGGVDGRVKVRNADWILENLFAEIVGNPVGAAVVEAASGEDETEAGSLVAAAAIAIAVSYTHLALPTKVTV